MSYWENKVVLITGASSGIGRGLAVNLARRGARLGLVARRASVLDEVISEIKSSGGSAEAIIADVQDVEALKSGAQRLAEVFGPIDMLIANAGVGTTTHASKLEPSEVNNTLQINVIGAANSVSVCFACDVGERQRSSSGHLESRSLSWRREVRSLLRKQSCAIRSV